MWKNWPLAVSQPNATGACGVRRLPSPVPAGAWAVVPAQRHRRLRGQSIAVRRPDRIGPREIDVLPGPAEAGEIGIGRTGRGEEAHRRRVGGDALAVKGQDEIVEAGAFEIDRA